MEDNPQNSEDRSLQPPSPKRICQSPANQSFEPPPPAVQSTLPEPSEVDAFWKFAYEERINALMNENIRLLNENALFKWEKKRKIDEKDEKPNVISLDDGSKKEYEEKLARVNQINGEFLEKIVALESVIRHDDDSINDLKEEIARKEQANAELQATNMKHVEKISALEKQHEIDQKEKKTLETAHKDEIACKEQVNAELQATNVNQANKISFLEKQHEIDQKEKKALETTIAKTQQSRADLQPLVIKKLFNHTGQKIWQCYSTSNDNEKPLLLSVVDSEILVGGVVSQMVLEGVISQFHDDPFLTDARGYNNLDEFAVSGLLKKVLSCNVISLYLDYQTLSWNEYEKLVSSRSVQNLYLFKVEIVKDRNENCVPLETLFEKLPNIQRFGYLSRSGITKETFKNLLKFPAFAKLQEFKLDFIHYKYFDAYGFLDFMKEKPLPLTPDPNTQFSIGFPDNYPLKYDRKELEAMKEMLVSRSTHNQLEIIN